MTFHGKVQNSVVVLDGGAELPEGTPVTVVVEQSSALGPSPGDRMTEEEHRRIMEIMDRIASLPIEGSEEAFSGADHDKVLYGEP